VSTSIYVWNLPYSASEEQLQHLFGAYETVERINLITDRDTGRLKGFGFVEMSSGAQEAISSLNQSELEEQTLTVSLAKPQAERPRQSDRW
jgi:RNA recognition motif-containing protein